MIDRTRGLLLGAVLLLMAGIGWLALRSIADPGEVPVDAASAPTSMVLPGRSPDTPMDLPQALGTGLAPNMLVVLFVDGLSARRFDEAWESGGLPELRALAARQPTWQGHARASFPTSTAPNVSEALTGRWAHVLGGMPDSIHALDRREARLVRYEVERSAWDGQARTLFDQVSGEGGTSWSYFEGYFPGASLNVHDELLYLLETVQASGREQAVLTYDVGEIEDFRRRWQSASKAPNLVFMRLGAIDTAGHFYGPEHSIYGEAIGAVDARIGEIIGVLEDTPMVGGGTALDMAHVVVFSDHGTVPTRRHVDLDALLRTAGLTPWPTSDAASVVASALDPKGLSEHDVVSVPSGSNVASLYLRARGPVRPLPWSKVPEPGVMRNTPRHDAPSFDLAMALVSQPDVDRVIYLDQEDTVVATSAEGALHIRRRHAPDGAWRLGVFVDGRDPYGDCRPGGPCCARAIIDTPEADACYRSTRQWRELSQDWDHPELPLMLHKVFSGLEARRPDAMIEAAPGAGFMADTRGDHGRYAPELLRVPLLISGPDVDPSAPLVDPRLVDLMPTFAQLMGLPLPAQPALDGEVLELFRPVAAAQ